MIGQTVTIRGVTDKRFRVTCDGFVLILHPTSFVEAGERATDLLMGHLYQFDIWPVICYECCELIHSVINKPPTRKERNKQRLKALRGRKAGRWS